VVETRHKSGQPETRARSLSLEFYLPVVRETYTLSVATGLHFLLKLGGGFDIPWGEVHFPISLLPICRKVRGELFPQPPCPKKELTPLFV